MKKLLITLLLVSVALGTLSSQTPPPTIAFHFCNPIALYQKVGAKIEYRTNQMGFLISAIQYYGTSPAYPGTQLALEWRKYAPFESERRSENFFYAKLIGGYQQHLNGSGASFLAVTEVPEGNYFGAGAGVGKHLNFNHFFLDLNAGLKAIASSVKQESAFYISGPASFLDLHLNIGYQF